MCPDTREAIPVLAAVIERDGRFLVTRRLAGSHLSGYWEFPGGKCNPGETHEACLARELREELGVEAHIGAELIITEHAYPERTVRLHFRRCEILGEPRPLLDQEMRWVSREEMRTLPFPEADREVINALTRAKGRRQRAKER
ncbi:MAG TPA: (deoxy)nucleoside triphosphate pyrophosphohydrolase [Vicinamibacterales bacterium]|nr:(deoxy)nucleoside triphosphate pyrophosphohydrolase [Vicinamibacterales bacterium]